MIVAGFGFRGSATMASLADAYHRAGPAQAAATVADKVPGVFSAFAAARGLVILPVAAEDLPGHATQTVSAASIAARGTSSVAEAAALAAAGPGARLLRMRVVSGDGCATCALAEGSR